MNEIQKKRKKYEEEYAKLRAQRMGTSNIAPVPVGNPLKSLSQNEVKHDLAPVYVKDTNVTKTILNNTSGIEFFKSSKPFDDGTWDFGDVTKTILGTTADFSVNTLAGVGNLAEGIGDAINYGIAGVADLFGADDFANSLREETKKSLVDQILGETIDTVDQYSVLGKTSDAIAQGAGMMTAIAATGGVLGAAGLGTAGITGVTTGVMGVSGIGSGMSEAYEGGATDKEARIYGVISGTADALSELIFGGLGKAVNAVGFSRGLSSADDMLAKKVSNMFSNQIMKNVSEFGIKAGAEGFEEVIAGLGQAIGKKITYMSEKDITDILADENLLEQFIVGSVTSGLMQTSGLVTANKTDTDFITGLTETEQKVVDKEVDSRIAELEQDGKTLTQKEKNKIREDVLSDLDKGYISIDTIEEVLGGEEYNNYNAKVEQENALQGQFDKLYKMKRGDMTTEQIDMLESLKQELQDYKNTTNTSQLKEQLSNNVFEIAKNSRLAESYNEQTRKGQTFEADLNQYDEKQRAVIQKAIDSGILNNTNRTHEFVDMVAKISADKGVLFDFTNNEKLKDSVFAVEGKTVNGFVNDNGDIVLNTNSRKLLDSVVGHEITHILEGTELYTELEAMVKQYATTKGEYAERMQSLREMYTGVYEGKDFDEKIRRELTADIVGDYLFTDSKFIDSLSTEKPNLFKKIYNEIKYLCKIATAGSKEARELEKVKRAFDKAYKQSGKAQGETKLSISEKTESDNHKKKQLDIINKYHPKADWDYQTWITSVDDIKTFAETVADESNYATTPDFTDDDVAKALKTGKVKVYSSHDIRNGTFVTPSYMEAKNYAGQGKVNYKIVNLTDVAWIDSLQGQYAPVETDTKYSLSDSDGKQLTKEQQDYFKDSKVRDENGNLKVMYHGTSKGGHTVFDTYGSNYGLFGQGSYFTDNKSVAESYTNKGKGNNKQVYESYLNVTNPLDMDAQGNINEWQKAFPEADFSNCNTNEEFYRAVEEYYSDQMMPKWEVAEIIKDSIQFNMGYDGITHIGGGRFNKSDDTRHRVYIAFEPEQIKNIDNIAPTKNADIRYSISEDNEGNKLSKGQQEYFKDSKAVDSNGNLLKVYHTTKNDFTVFDKSKKGEATEDANTYLGFFFTDNAEYMQNFPQFENGKTEAYYLNMTNPIDMTDISENAFVDIIEVLGGDVYNAFDIYEEAKQENGNKPVHLIHLLQDMVGEANYTELIEELKPHYDELMSKGYDGVINYLSEYRGVKEYIVLDSNQAKLVTNTNPTKNEDIRYSLSDSEGRELSKEQQDYFKDSKVVDEKGSLKVVYHGSRNADFTVFKRNVNFFTDNKEMADSYSPNGKMFEGYLNIKNPYEFDAQGEKWSRMPIDAETKRFLEEYGGSVFKEGGKWRTTPADIAAAIEEAVDNGDMDYDGIIIRNIDDTGSYYKGKEKHIATDYIVFNSNQFKNANNKAPTSNSDIRFSLSESVEETKDLVAVHNLSEEKLLKSLKLGGLPMPSIAIIKAKTGHKNFGDISIVFDKSTIDPKLSKYNKVFTSDAYTPTYPHIDYKIDSEVVEKGVDEVERLIKSKGYGKDDFGYLSSIDGDIFRYGNTEEVANKTALKVAYLIDKGIDFTPIYEEKAYSNFGRFDNEIIKYIADVIGEERINELHNNTEGVMNALEEIRNLASERKAEKYKDNESLYKSLKEKPFYGENNFGFSQAHEIVEGAYNYFNNGARRQIDEWQTANEIKDLIDNDDYKKWVDNLFNGFIEKEGIRNNVDLFTPSGNRRSFEALHWEHNLENVIKSMRTGLQQGNALFGSSIYGASQVELKSIADIKKDSNRLVDVDSEESKEAYLEKRKDLELRFTELVSSIVRDNGNNVFMAMDDASAVLVESVLKCKTKTAMDNYIKRELEGWGNYSDTLADDLMDIVNELRALPTGYFEAKPQRAVMFDEVATVIIPDNTSIELKKMLEDNGIKYVEYESGNEQARVEALNSLEELKFSLSKENEIAPIVHGKYNVYGKDIAYQPTASKTEQVENAIAPIQEVVAENATTTWRDLLADNNDPLSDENGVFNPNYEEIVSKIDYLLEDELIRDIESGMTSEQLLEKSRNAQNEYEAFQGDGNTISGLLTPYMLQQQQALYESASKNPQDILFDLRVEQYNRDFQDQDQFNPLTDEDAPPIKEAPYYERDTVELPNARVVKIAKSVYEYVFPEHKEKAELRSVIRRYASGEIPDKFALFDEIKKVYGERTIIEENKELLGIQNHLRNYRINVTDDIKAEYPEWAEFMRHHKGRILFANDGAKVDDAYQELSNLYPHYFPDTIWNAADQFARMVEVSKMDRFSTDTMELLDEDIQKATDIIADGVTKYTEAQLLKLSEKENRAFYRMSAKDWEKLMPPIADEMQEVTTPSKNIAPVKQTKQSKGKMQDDKIAKILMSEPKVDKKSGLKRDWERFTSNFVDKATPVETLALERGNRELDAKYNTIRYANTKAQTVIGEGVKEKGVKSLNEIFGQFGSEADLEKFYNYLYHKHNVDRMSLESREAENLGRLTEEMRKLKLDTLEEKQLYAIAKESTDNTTEKRAHIIETVREYLKSLGVENKAVYGDSVTAEISQEIVEKYEFNNPDFIKIAEDVYNFNRHLRSEMVDGGLISQETADLFEELYPHYVPIRRVNHNGIGVNVPLDTRKTGINAPIKRAEGGNSDILPLAQTMAQRTLQTYKAVAKNRFGVELKNTLGTTVEKAETDVDEIIEGVDTHEDLLKEGKYGANPTFTVFENGEKVTFEITEALYDALKPTSEAMSKTYNIVSKPTGLFKKLVTEYNPAFMLTNPIKDTQDVLLNSQHPLQTYKNYPKAIKELISKGKWYNEYLKNGGSDDTYFDNETNTFTEEKSGVKNVVGFPFEKISEANNFLERLPRLAEYIASREMGRSIDVAMLDSARVTTNFRAGGDVTKFLNRNGFTFLNPSVQGAVQQVRNVREAKANGLKGWGLLATKVMLAGLPGMLLNGLLWDDDDDYEELSDYVKQNYYVVWKNEDGKFIRIPKGRALAVIQDAFTQVQNALTGDDEIDISSFLELVANNIAPNNPLENNILAPIMQVKNNKTWYGEDLVPSRLADLPAKEQFDESTDKFSKWLGDKLDISPVKVNYLLNQYSGGVGDMILPMLTPEAESGKNSILSNFTAPIRDKFTTDSVMNNQNVSNFYELSDELKVNANSSEATEEDILKNKYINAIRTQMSELYKEKREIQNNEYLNDSEKYNRVREIQAEINSLSEEALNSYNTVDISGKYAEIGDKQYKLNNDNEWQKLSDDEIEKQNEVIDILGITKSQYWNNKKEYDMRAFYPEKYAVLQEQGISVEDYKENYEEMAHIYTDDYSWASDNPEKYTLSKAVTDDVSTYKKYTSDLYNIKADKDSNGKSITGSRKEKVHDYIFNLNIDDGSKYILFKSEYNADDTYNSEIVDYLNNRDDISAEEMVTILQELGATVDAEGYIYW